MQNAVHAVLIHEYSVRLRMVSTPDRNKPFHVQEQVVKYADNNLCN